MEQYVAMFYGSASQDEARARCLGRTILCHTWQQAVDQCVKLAREQGEDMTDEQIASLDSEGEYSFGSGNVHIGGLEDPE